MMRVSRVNYLSISLGCAFLAIAILVAYFGVRYIQTADAVATVDGQVITKQDVQKWMWVSNGSKGEYKSINIKSDDGSKAINDLVELMIVSKEAATRKVDVSDQAAKDFMSANNFKIPKGSSQEREQAVIKYNKLAYLREALAKALIDWKEGEYVQIPLDTRFFVDHDGYISDKSYGRQLANSIYEQWKSGKVDFEGAAKLAKQDARLGIDAVSRINDFNFLEFGYKIDRESYMQMPKGQTRTAFSNMKNGFNAPVVIVADIYNPHSLDRNKSQAHDDREIIIAHITNAGGEPGFETYDSWYASIKSKHRVKQ